MLAVVVGPAVFTFPAASRADDSYLTDCLSSRISCRTGTEVVGAGDSDKCVRDVFHNHGLREVRGRHRLRAGRRARRQLGPGPDGGIRVTNTATALSLLWTFTSN